MPYVQLQRYCDTLSVTITTVQYSGADFSYSSNLWVLQPHLQPLHSHESSLFVAARSCEQTQQISGHVVHRLPAVQLIPEDVQHIVLHTLCQLLVPTEAQRVGQRKMDHLTTMMQKKTFRVVSKT